MAAAALTPDPRSRWEGRSADDLRRHLGLPHVEVWPQIGSTNDRARALLEADAGVLSMVLADEQTEGRGRANRRWHSPPGTGLWVSFILRPQSLQHRSLLPLFLGIGLARAIERQAGPGAEQMPRIGLKWPNDVWLGGGKVAGILCEATPRGVVAGIGVNVAAVPDEMMPDRGAAGDGAAGQRAAGEGQVDERAVGAALAEAPGSDWSRLALLEGLVDELRILAAEEPDRLSGALADEWRQRDVLRGRRVRVGSDEGRVEGVDDQGHLLLATSSGLRRVAAGHVHTLHHTLHGQERFDAAGR